MLIQTSQSSHQRLLKRSFVLNMYIYICFIYTKGQDTELKYTVDI